MENHQKEPRSLPSDFGLNANHRQGFQILGHRLIRPFAEVFEKRARDLMSTYSINFEK